MILKWQSVLLFCTFCLLGGCGGGDYKAFEKRMKDFVEPKGLQEWAVAILRTHQVGYEIPKSEWPSFLTVTNGPSSAWIAGWTTVKERAVFVAWGNGFGHTGLIVGEKTFVITEEDLNSPVVQWIPGVYFVPKPGAFLNQ